ncbi:MAG: hypothetical protein ABSG58_03515 [Acidimicrobiales bacterium]
MSPARAPRLRVVVDGSNLATEGRLTPSLKQLDEAVSAFADEHPGAEIIVVADATFEHRAAANERSRFLDATMAGDIVTPPAGAVGRGDAFILKIADRIGGVVLSNDSFQEFHDEYPWLFDVGRLIGGKPVRGVGWVFTERVPVRNSKVPQSVKKLAVTLASGAKPTIGTTITPVKAKKAPAAKKTPPKADKAIEKIEKVAKAPARATKKSAKPVVPEKKRVLKKQVAKVADKPAKKVAKVPAPPEVAPAVALKRGRQPVNPEAEFATFKSTYRVGSRVPGEVTAFTSHGAVIKVELKGGQQVECYAPTTLLGDPPPARARDVLKRGDQRVFRLVTVDSDRRIAELALV